MSKRELNLSDKKLFISTKEDIILRSPSKIPTKGLQDLINMNGIIPSDTAYYDISQTEAQSIDYKSKIDITFFKLVGFSTLEGNMKMGNFVDL